MITETNALLLILIYSEVRPLKKSFENLIP